MKADIAHKISGVRSSVPHLFYAFSILDTRKTLFSPGHKKVRRKQIMLAANCLWLPKKIHLSTLI